MRCEIDAGDNVMTTWNSVFGHVYIAVGMITVALTEREAAKLAADLGDCLAHLSSAKTDRLRQLQADHSALSILLDELPAGRAIERIGLEARKQEIEKEMQRTAAEVE